MASTEKARLLSISTPAGPDAFVLSGFSGREGMSQLFHFELEMLSGQEGLSARDLVGHGVTWTVHPADGEVRCFHGVVSSFSAGHREGRGLRSYRAVVVPWFALLAETEVCRVFENQSVPEVVETLLRDVAGADYLLTLARSYPKRDRCVQYRETTLQFLSRLLEEEGICYFFRHEEGRHTLILADDPGGYGDCLEKRVGYFPAELARRRVASWEHTYAMPGDLKGSTGESITGWSRCHTFTPGCRFTLEGHDAAHENGGYVVVAVEHAARVPPFPVPGAVEEYRNTFTCIADSVRFRPERVTPRPVVKGPQAAIVVADGAEGESRPRLEFLWDGKGKRDRHNSAWVGIAEGWTGRQSGPAVAPHTGQEVLVDFLDGDPDRPILRPSFAAPGTEAGNAIEWKVGPSRIRIEPTGIAIEGMVVRIDGQAYTEVKGLIAQIGADAVLEVKGPGSGIG